MSTVKATAVANSNIAFVKYWGNADPVLHLPANPSAPPPVPSTAHGSKARLPVLQPAGPPSLAGVRAWPLWKSASRLKMHP